MTKFSKSESYIRSRLRLCTLIASFADLLISEEINLTVPLKLCKYSKETQEEIFEGHDATDNSYKNCIGKRAKDIVEMIEHNYTTNLNDYFLIRQSVLIVNSTVIFILFSVMQMVAEDVLQLV